MPSSDAPLPSADAPVPPRGGFATTHWSVVVRAGQQGSPDAEAALSRLCRVYWYPLYAHVRRRGCAPHDAQDLTQEFFARLLQRQMLAHADPARGRFRSFILTALDHFLRDEWEKARAQKRGGGADVVSLDIAAAEDRFQHETTTLPPDRAFDRHWALALLDSVLGQLEAEYRRDAKAVLFAALKQTLTGGPDAQPYAEIAARLGLSEGAVKIAAHRLRQRYRALLKAEIANTVASPEDIADEMRHLLGTFAENA